MEPRPGALDTSTVPWCCRTMPWTTARPSPVPRPGALVVKKGSKMRSSVPAGMPAPVSSHRQLHHPFSGHGRVPGGELGVHLDVPGPDGERSALGHGVPGVDAEVHQHLLQLGRVAGDGPQLLGELGLQLHRLADDPAEQALHVEHHLVEAQRALGERLTPGEGEQLADQRAGALALPLDLREVGLRGVVHREVEPGQRRGALDAGEDVVEVVGHAAGEHAHGVHLLGALHLGLETLALGDVAHAHHQPLVAAGDLGHRQLEVNHGPVAAAGLAGAAPLPHVALEARGEQLVRRAAHRPRRRRRRRCARRRGSWTPAGHRRSR